MSNERWNRLSDWHDAWLEADVPERERLRAELAAERPDLIAEADELAAASGHLPGFLETPAFALLAPDLAKDEPPLAAETMVGPYRIVDLLARGGMGDVYRATDIRLRRDVALKVLASDRTGDAQRVERFVQEARVTASLDHPNIVRLYDIGVVDGRPYFVAELLDGETSRARLERGPLPLDEALRIVADVARGLVTAHAAGLVHRDLKPENVFLTRAGETKILDFGIAKLAHHGATREGLSTTTGVVLGTAGYLAPEQIRGEHVDGRADLFALGVMLFEMLTGQGAFRREHTVDTLHAILHEVPPDLLELREDVTPVVAALVTRLLEKTPDARFQSAADLVQALNAVADTRGRSDRGPERSGEGTTTPASPASSAPGLRTTTARVAHQSRRRGVVAVALVLALALASGWFLRRAMAPAPAAATPTLAILPFRSLPDSADSQLLELGLADVFIGRLNQLPDIRVLPLSATERLRGVDPHEAGRALGADRVLTGTLQRDQRRVRASVQLVSTSDARPIWATAFDADADTAFSIQDAVVTRVIEEIAPRLSAEARVRLARAGTRSTEAFEANLRGRAHIARASAADMARAIELFRQAVTLDPGYADAWAGLALAYRRLPLLVNAAPHVAFPEARRAAARALEIDPQHADAHVALGTVAFWYDWDYPRAEALLRRAVARQPSSAEARVYLAHLLSNLGRHEEAIAEIRRARELDPVMPIAQSLEGQFLVMARRYEDAIPILEQLLKREPQFLPGHWMGVYPLLALRRYDEAVRQCDVAIDVEASLNTGQTPQSAAVYSLRGFALARANRREEAERDLAWIRRRASQRYVPPVLEAVVLHALGRDDEALAQLDRAVEVRDFALTRVGVDPNWDEIRTSPAFQAIMSRVNLLEVSNRALATRR